MEINESYLAELAAKAELLKSLAHPIRLCIVKGLSEEGECSVGKMQSCLGLPQSTVSQHLGKLRACGIVKGRREGLEVFYSIGHPGVPRVIRALFE